DSKKPNQAQAALSAPDVPTHWLKSKNAEVWHDAVPAIHKRNALARRSVTRNGRKVSIGLSRGGCWSPRGPSRPGRLAAPELLGALAPAAPSWQIPQRR